MTPNSALFRALDTLLAAKLATGQALENFDDISFERRKQRGSPEFDYLVVFIRPGFRETVTCSHEYWRHEVEFRAHSPVRKQALDRIDEVDGVFGPGVSDISQVGLSMEAGHSVVNIRPATGELTSPTESNTQASIVYEFLTSRVKPS